MSTITLPNIRVSSDLTVKLKLKDGGVALDWSTLQNIKVSIYSDAQRALAGRCGASIDAEDPTLLVCAYAANKPQYVGVNRVVVSAKYMGETKTYDKPAFNFVRWTDDQAGEQITIDDPDIDVEISVEDVSSSILQEAIDAAFQAAADAEAAAHLVPLEVLQDCVEATGEANAAADAANAAAGRAPYIGENGNWFVWDVETGAYVDSGEESKGDTGDAAGFGTFSVTETEDGGDPSVTVQTSGPDTAKNVSFQLKNFKGDKGDKGDQGNSGYQGAAGELEVVNNLTDGGSTAALSAEMGKTLKGEVSQLEAKVIEKNVQTALAEGNMVELNYADAMAFFEHLMSGKGGSVLQCNGKTLDQIYTGTDNSFTALKIPLVGLEAVDIYSSNSTAKWGSVVMDSADKAIYGIVSTAALYEHWKRIPVTSAMSYIVFNLNSAYSALDGVVRLYPTGYRAKQLKLDQALGCDYDWSSVNKDGLMELGLFAAGNNVIPAVGANFLSTFGASANIFGITTYNYLIVDVKGFAQYQMYAVRSSVNYPAAFFCDEDMNVLSSRVVDTSSPNLTNLTDIGENVRYIVYLSYLSNTSYPYFRLKKEGIDQTLSSDTARITALEEQASAEGEQLTFSQGDINTDGEIIDSQYRITSKAIDGGKGFFLYTNEGYAVYAVHLFDKNGELKAYNYLPPRSLFAEGHEASVYVDNVRRFCGIETIQSGYAVKVVLCRADNGILNNKEDVVSQFGYLNDGRLSSEAIETANRKYFTKRVRQMSNIRWTPRANIPGAGASDAAFFVKGRTRFGVPYSEAAEFSKYIGQQVSFYTFLTAIHNKRSLMYTENIENGHSESAYGFTYHGTLDLSSCYFGTVCTGLTAYAMGLKNIFVSGDYANGVVTGLTQVQNADSQNVKAMDIIWKTGHCSVVLDIILDEYGERKFIIWAEETLPSVVVSAYTPEMFEARLANESCQVYRFNGWANLTAPEDTPFIQLDWMDYPKDIKYNDDICTFAGDKATFGEGDKIYLNINRTPGYSSLLIYKDDVLVHTIDISNTSTYPSDGMYPEDGEDWVKFNATPLNLTPGMYKARLYDGQSYSDYTYWEVLDITASQVQSGNSVTISFSSSNATPYLVRQEKQTGIESFGTYYHYFTQSEVSAGSVTLNWSVMSTATWNKVFFRGQYGVAVKFLPFE